MAALCAKLGVSARVVPMSDQPVRTMVQTHDAELAFQDYFVRLRCEPALRGLRFEGLDQAAMSAGFRAALDDPALEALVFCPSNPYLSIRPILALAGVESRLSARRVPAVAVSPIIGGRALKGPAAKIMRELGHEPSALEVARAYRGLIDGFVLDAQDAALARELEAGGLRSLATDTVMRDSERAAALAREVIAFAAGLAHRA
jgi:LPPG:FO 2-phospho-L-lactate transferase